jgi:hypothetical protein
VAKENRDAHRAALPDVGDPDNRSTWSTAPPFRIQDHDLRKQMLRRNMVDEWLACGLEEIVDRADLGQKTGASRQTVWTKIQVKYSVAVAKHMTCMVKHKGIPD